MKLRFILVAVALLGVFTTSFAQLTEEQKNESSEIMLNIRKLELYNQILPILLTKDQINKILTVLEKHRADSRTYEQEEHKYIVQLKKEVDDALKEAQDDGKVSDPQVVLKAISLFSIFTGRRNDMISKTMRDLSTTMKAELNEGQISAAVNAFDPRLFNPRLDPEKMTDDDKLNLWITMILLEPLAYDVILEISRK